MKKYFNKILVISITAIILSGILTPLSLIKAAAFNNNPQDYATLRVANYTKNPGSSGSWSSSVSADAGDIISFDLYFHNTAPDTATQTMVRAILPTGSFTSASVTGSVWAQNASLVSNNVNINLSSSQALTLISGSVKWYPDQTMTAQTLLYGQNGSEVVSAAGLNVGDVASGWPTQGHVVFRAQVSNNFTAVSSAPSATTNAASNITTTSAMFNAQINPNNSYTTAWFEYGTNFSSLSSTTSPWSIGSGSSSSNISSTVFYLSSNTTYYFRAVAQNSQGTTYGSTLSFTTSASSTASAPSATTNSATSISTNSATLNASINPNSDNATAWFEYGTSSSSLASTSASYGMGSGSFSASLSTTISGLSSNTTYYFRAVAQNSQGTTYGSTLSFTTSASGSTTTSSSAPSVTTYSTSGVDITSATFNAQINPNSSSTTAWFEYGTSLSSLTKSTSTQSMGLGTSYINLATSTYGLSSNTIYYVRPAASNSFGTTYGLINTFITKSESGSSSSSSTSTSSTTTTTISSQSVSTVPASSAQSNIAISQTVRNLNSSNGNNVSLFADPQDVLEYKLIVKNNDSMAVRNIKVSFQMPSVFRYADSSPRADFDPVGNILSRNISSLNRGAETALTFEAKIEGGLNSMVKTEATAYIPSKNLTIYSNNVQVFIGYQKPIVLIFKADKNEAKVGDVLNYSIIVKNPNDYGLKNILLSIGLAENTDLQDADFPVSARTENNLLVDMGDLAAGKEIVKNFSVKIGNNAKDNDILTTSAIANYQDEAGNSQPIVSAMTSVMITGSANVAAAIFSGIGSLSIFDWLVVLLVAGGAFVGSVLIRRIIRMMGQNSAS